MEERPLGGTETAVIRLAEALHAFGAEVIVASEETEIPFSNPRYVPFREVNKMGAFDVVIVVRDWNAAFLPFNAKALFLWTGDNWDNPHTFGMGDPRIYKHLKGLFSVSAWHADTLAIRSGFPRDKIHVLPNGIHLPYFKGEEVRRKRLIYTATPERGLVHLLEIFPRLRERHPDLELAVFSSFDRYQAEIPLVVPSDKPYYPLYQKLSQMPGCTVHQSILQKELAREMLRSTLFVYPSHFEETSCISAMEAQAAGCPVVTSDLSALKESVGEGGVLIEGDPASSTYREKFVEACDQLLTDSNLFALYSEKGKKHAATLDWKERAKALLAYLKGVIP